MIDIIIPTYKNKDGLRTTLDSIDWNNNNFSITIIDDASNLDYSDIIVEYPNINQLVVLPQNGGPGMARQYGIDHTNNDYLLFIDTGDYFISKTAQFQSLHQFNAVLTKGASKALQKLLVGSYVLAS